MPIIERRTFYGKVGAAGELIETTKAFFEAMNSSGHNLNYRILSDYQSGRTDRVVYEMEAESLAAMEADMNSMMGDEELGQALGKLEARLNELITHAEVEHWKVAE